MSTALHLINQLEDINNQIKDTFTKLSEDLSDIDKVEQQVLHEIEFKSFNAVEGYFYAKRLKEIRQKRREIKDTIQPFQSLFCYTTKNQHELNKIKKKISSMHRDEIHEKNALKVIQPIVDIKVHQTSSHINSGKGIS